jgi:hypothetical protein
MLLDDEQLDEVTAAGIRIDLDLAASAEGPEAVTSTEGAVSVGRTTASLVAIDAAAPQEARVRLIGEVQADVGIAAGKATANGASDATCSAAPTVTGAAYNQVVQSQSFTAGSAICSCGAVAVNLVGG